MWLKISPIKLDHYTNMILNRTLDNSQSLGDFGIQLTLKNIEEHIKQFILDKEQYYNDFPNEVEHIKNLYLSTQEVRRKNCFQRKK